MKKITIILTALIMISLASAQEIGVRPDDIPANATVETGEELLEAPTTQGVSTNISITRTHKANTTVGETVKVTIRVSNNHDAPLTLLVVEPQRPGLEYINAPEPYMRTYENLQVPLMRWREEFRPGENKEYTYSIRKTGTGSVLLAAATVTDQYGKTYATPASSITFACNPDGFCQKGEDYIFCPQDCQTGSEDNTCDGIQDGRMDPDCMPEADPDYQKTTTTLPAKTTPKQTTGCIPMTTLLLSGLVAAAIRTFNQY
ncbi:MAG: hypothetical protein ABIH11_07720 [Candidatus Altiarchaeota archaeon]